MSRSLDTRGVSFEKLGCAFFESTLPPPALGRHFTIDILLHMIIIAQMTDDLHLKVRTPIKC